MLAAFLMASKLINILVANHQHGRLLRDARFHCRASFMCQVSSVATWQLECASEDDTFTNKWSVSVAVAPNWSARADAPSAALNPLFYIEAGVFDCAQQDQASRARIMERVMMLKLDSEPTR
jgi:hypothetical protein